MHGGVARCFIAIGGNGSHIGYASVTGCVPLEEAQANARLIAAAPDLLAALKAMDDAFSHYCEGDPSEDEIAALQQARAALKAGGAA